MLSNEGTASITATFQATGMLKRLVLTHGPLALFQSGGCCDGSLPLCLLADDLAPGPGDVLLGEVAGVPFYIDAEQFRRWGDPEFLLDVGPGAPEGFSLGLPDAHFVTLSPACRASAAETRPGDGSAGGRTRSRRPLAMSSAALLAL